MGPGMQIFHSHISEAMFTIGMFLERGRSLINALESVAVSARSYRLRDAAYKAADLLKQGIPPEQVFRSKDFFVFPAQIRYILACPLPEELKGKVIVGWYRRKFSLAVDYNAFFYPVMTLAIGILSSIALILFVIPQFREILYGLRIEPTPLLKFFFGADRFSFDLGLVMLMVAFASVLIIMVAVFRWFFRMRSIGDYINFLNIMASVPSQERLRVIPAICSRVIFASEFQKIRLFSTSIEQGKSIEEAVEHAGFPGFLRWFIGMCFFSENSTEMLNDGSFLLTTLFNSRSKLLMHMIEIMITISFGIFFGTIIYAIFSGMILILQSSI
jgi:type II secretory pathway component PulF